MPQPKKPASPARKPAAATKPAAAARKPAARGAAAKAPARPAAAAKRSASGGAAAARKASGVAAAKRTASGGAAAARKASGVAAAKRTASGGGAPKRTRSGAGGTPAKNAAARSAATKLNEPARRAAAAKPSGPPLAPPTADDVVASLGALRERLVSSLTLTSERLQETVDDAVRRGRMTRKDAEELLGTLVAAGRAQTEAILADVEQMLGRGSGVRVRATTGDAVLRTVDRARRRVGVGSFPILGYDDLTAAQITRRLADLTPAQLRKVRDYERRHDARKSLLGAIDRKLG